MSDFLPRRPKAENPGRHDKKDSIGFSNAFLLVSLVFLPSRLRGKKSALRIGYEH
jgi:hypothetical protein